MVVRSWQACVLWLACGAALSSGCAYHVYSPPARNLPLESVATLPVASQAVAADFGSGHSIFGPSLIAASLRTRRGVAEQLDAVLEANFIRVVGKPDAESPASRNAYSLRAGAKYRVCSFAAISGGVGGGGYAGGGFISPDVGVILAFENPYIVPLLALRGFVSQPVARRRVDLGTEDEERVLDFPLTTWGFASSVGARIPFLHRPEPSHALLLGMSFTMLGDTKHHEAFISPSVSFELVF